MLSRSKFYLTGGSEEARALRGSVGHYNARLQELWDAAFMEMVNPEVYVDAGIDVDVIVPNEAGATAESYKHSGGTTEMAEGLLSSPKHAGENQDEVSPGGKHYAGKHAGKAGAISGFGKREYGMAERRAERARKQQEMAKQRGDTTEMVDGRPVQYSIGDYGLDNLGEETVSNIRSRGQYIVTSRAELMQHIDAALNGNEQKTVFIGAIPEATKKSLEEETGVSIFRPLEYAYGISYDGIRHIEKHFSTSEEVADAIETVFSMIDDHDSVEVIKRKDGGINLMFKKGYDAIEVESVALTSNRTRSLTVKTAYISRVHEKGAKIDQAATFQSTGSSHLDPSSNDSVPQSSESVNGNIQKSARVQTETEAFKRWFKDSKVVDEDGNPLVVYHGTEADFNAFDMSKGRANMDIQGAFFSPYIEDAGGYGGNVKAVYLSIQNPANESTAYRALNKFKGQNGAGVKARELLIRMGYDGVYNGYDEYIAFYPEQIKSATDNVGTFDPENPDIRYSRRTASTPDIAVRDMLKGMQPSNRMNETEKILLKRYQEDLQALEEKEKQIEAQEEIIRTSAACSLGFVFLRPAEVLPEGSSDTVRLVSDGTYMGGVLQPQHSLASTGYAPEDYLRTVGLDDGICMALHHQHRALYRMQIAPGHPYQPGQMPPTFAWKARIAVIILVIYRLVACIAGLPPDGSEYRASQGRQPKRQSGPHGSRDRRKGGRLHLLAKEQRQATALAQPCDADILAFLPEPQECLLGCIQPILPAKACHVLHTGSVARQIDPHDGESLRLQALCDQPHMRRRPGKAMKQQYAVAFSHRRLSLHQKGLTYPIAEIPFHPFVHLHPLPS